MVNASRAPEEGELADAQDSLGRPRVVTWPCLAEHAADLAVWLRDRRDSRQAPPRR
jgi:hypothetical protein